METQNLRSALEELSDYNSIEENPVLRRLNNDILEAANKELDELQRMAEVVKGFIEDYGITCRSELKTIDHDEALDLMVDICDIVGYHKE